MKVARLDPEKTLISDRLLLQPLSQEHASILYWELQRPELYRYIPHGPPKSVLELQEKYAFWEHRGSPERNEIWLNYAVRLRESNEYVGTLQATVFDTQKASIAYETFPRFWRRHFAREGCLKMIDYLFRDDVEEVNALVDTENIASWHLLSSIGFSRLKKIERADFFKGRYSDEYLYALKK